MPTLAYVHIYTYNYQRPVPTTSQTSQQSKTWGNCDTHSFVRPWAAAQCQQVVLPPRAQRLRGVGCPQSSAPPTSCTGRRIGRFQRKLPSKSIRSNITTQISRNVGFCSSVIVDLWPLLRAVAVGSCLHCSVSLGSRCCVTQPLTRAGCGAAADK